MELSTIALNHIRDTQESMQHTKLEYEKTNTWNKLSTNNNIQTLNICSRDFCASMVVWLMLLNALNDLKMTSFGIPLSYLKSLYLMLTKLNVKVYGYYIFDHFGIGTAELHNGSLFSMFRLHTCMSNSFHQSSSELCFYRNCI